MRDLPCLIGLACLAVPLYGAEWNVPAGGDLQAAINSAAPGDTITLQAGATYQGTYTLPNKSGANWITIRSSKLSSLPADGIRVKPSDAANMPKIMAFGGNPVFQAQHGAHHYRLTGLEIIPQPGVYNYNLIVLGYGNETSVAQLPQYLELDRMYIHGDLNVGTKRGITLNSRDTTIKNSWISGIASATQEAQAIQGWNGTGPYTITNNYLEASSIGVLFGGATPAIAGVVPSDIQIRRNYFFKPLSWRKSDPSYAGKPWWIKNHLEIKNGQRITIDGNVFENCWADQQSGVALLFMPANEGGSAPWVVAQDIVVSNNIVRHSGSGVNISGCDGATCGGRRITIDNNLFDDINSGTWGGYGRLFTLVNKTDTVTITHNTAFQSGAITFSDGGIPNTGFVFQNNIAPHYEYGMYGSGYSSGNPALGYYFTSPRVSGNVFPEGPATVYPAGNYFPASMRDVGFVNLGAGNLRLAPTSPYNNKGTDGRDIGVDYDALLTATANTVGGNPYAVPAVPAIGAPGAAAFVKTDIATQGNWKGVYGANGYAIASLRSTLPASAGLTFAGSGAWVWSTSTTQTKALANPAGGRIAATYYGPSWFAFELKLDVPQQLALYCLDYDGAGRAQIIDIVDRRTGAVLDSRAVTAFQNGTYVVWTVSGDIVVQVSSTSRKTNSAVAGIFLGPVAANGGTSPPTAPSATAVFQAADNTTQGTWRNTYGSGGYTICQDTTSMPAYAQVTLQGGSPWVYAASTTDVRALQKGANASSRIEAVWYAASAFTVDLNITGGQTHTVAFYIADYDRRGRAESVQVLDAATGTILSTRSESAFTSGRYLVWKLSGHVKVKFTATAGPNAVLSGVFFDSAAVSGSTANAVFQAVDDTTQGRWRNAYGTAGYTIAFDGTSIPAYAKVTVAGYSSWLYAASTTDVRALQKAANANDRISGVWYAPANFTVDVNLTDGQTHRVSFYIADYDRRGRAETIRVVDAGTGAVLSARTESAFGGGRYLSWKLSGHVRVQFAATGGPNVVLSGVFFD